MSYGEALVDGLYSSMESDPTVSLIGSYVLGLGPQRHHIDRVREAFTDRVFDPPTAEAGMAAIGIGAAMGGARPFVDVATASFVLNAWPQIVNEAANAYYMSGGSPRDIKGLIRNAIKSNNPTVILDHAKLLGIEGEVPEGDYEIPFGQADIKREGRDITVVGTSAMVQVALEAADTLSKDGIEVEVVDPRTIVPLDKRTICESVGKTGRLVVVDECNLSCSIASEIAAIVAEEAFSALKKLISRRPRTRLRRPSERC
jgi:pyruvate dehydrogenase E1 component beta subunit